MSRLQNSASFSSMNESSYIHSNTFLTALRLARQIHRQPTLKKIWSGSRFQNTSAFSRMIQANYRFSSPLRPTKSNIITPGGFILPVMNTYVSNGNIRFQLPAFSSFTEISHQEVGLSMNMIICFYSPLDWHDDFYNLTSLWHEIRDYDFGKPFNFKIDFNKTTKIAASRYADSIVYLAAVTKNVKGKFVNYSKTYSEDFGVLRKTRIC